jgi:hypothetical protein
VKKNRKETRRERMKRFATTPDWLKRAEIKRSRACLQPAMQHAIHACGYAGLKSAFMAISPPEAYHDEEIYNVILHRKSKIEKVKRRAFLSTQIWRNSSAVFRVLVEPLEQGEAAPSQIGRTTLTRERARAWQTPQKRKVRQKRKLKKQKKTCDFDRKCVLDLK